VQSRRTSSPVAPQFAREADSAFKASLEYTMTVANGGCETATGARHLRRWQEKDACWGF